jgi:PAS domain S-box-containing protein
MVFLSFFHFFSALIYIYLLVFILIRNWRSPLNRICAIVFFCFAIWCFGKTVTHDPYVSKEIALSFMKFIILGAWTFSGFLLCFSLVFTEKQYLYRNKWTYLVIFFIPILSIVEQWRHGSILAYVKHPFGWGLQWQGSPLTHLLLAYFFSSITLCIIFIFVFIKKTSNPIKKKQATIIGVSTLLAFAIGYPTNILIPRLTSASLPDLAQNMALIWAAGLVYAIAKYKFMVISPATAAENIISTMTDTLILSDPGGKIVTVNRAGIELLGYRRKSIVGKDFTALLDEKNREMSHLMDKIKQEPITERDVHFKSKEGLSIPVSFSSSLLKGEENEIVGIICIARDITERKNIEQEMKAARILAERASMAKSEFMANMSHELRTPLNHIIGFTELVLGKHLGDLNEKQTEYLTDVHSSSRHLLSLINDILDLSKVEAGKLGFQPNSINLPELLRKSIIIVKETAMKNSIKIKLDTDDIPDIITADVRLLKQIMYNLLSNAVKFTPKSGQVSITASIFRYDGAVKSSVSGKKGTAIKISVSDTGIGIKTEDIARIFNSFEQVENGASRRYQGTGLGLSLTKNLVELHGGRIWVESDGINKGSTFSFTIPL